MYHNQFKPHKKVNKKAEPSRRTEPTEYVVLVGLGQLRERERDESQLFVLTETGRHGVSE